MSEVRFCRNIAHVFCCIYTTAVNVYETLPLWANSADNLGPVVQSVVSLTSSLRAISLTILADSIYNFLKFFAEKM